MSDVFRNIALSSSNLLMLRSMRYRPLLRNPIVVSHRVALAPDVLVCMCVCARVCVFVRRLCAVCVFAVLAV